MTLTFLRLKNYIRIIKKQENAVQYLHAMLVEDFDEVAH